MLRSRSITALSIVLASSLLSGGLFGCKARDPDTSLEELRGPVPLPSDSTQETPRGRSWEAVLQELLEAEMTEALGAEEGERTPPRWPSRAGGRTLVTRVGKLELRVPQDRAVPLPD
jgi:Transposase, Mutator family